MLTVHTHACIHARLNPEQRWDFETANAGPIATHWAALTVRQPSVFDGPVLMAHAHAVGPRGLEVGLLRTRYAAFMAWRAMNHPPSNAKLCFPMAALRTLDGYYVLGTMGAHTSNPGRSYFPSGTLNDDDVLPDGTVALARAMCREVEEETGFSPADYQLSNRWLQLENAARCGFFQDAQLHCTRAEAAERVAAFLARQAEPELAGVVFVKTPGDLAGLELPVVQRDYFNHVWAAG